MYQTPRFNNKISKLEGKLGKNPRKDLKIQSKIDKLILKKTQGSKLERESTAAATSDAEEARLQQEADRTFMEGEFSKLEEKLGKTPAAPTFSQSPFRLGSTGGVRRRKSSRRTPTSLASLRIAPTALNTGSSGSGALNFG